MHALRWWSVATVCLGGILGGCSHEPSTADAGTLELHVSSNVQADVLIVIDTEDPGVLFPSTLVPSVDHLLQPFRARAARDRVTSLHLGVITTDLGAGATGAPGCGHGGEGDGGQLQAPGRKADSSCAAPLGGKYLDLTLQPDGTTIANTPAGIDVAKMVACMSAIGSTGCGFRHTLEAARVALSGDVPGNQGFLRNDAVLAVLFVTRPMTARRLPTAHSSTSWIRRSAGSPRFAVAASVSSAANLRCRSRTTVPTVCCRDVAPRERRNLCSSTPRATSTSSASPLRPVASRLTRAT